MNSRISSDLQLYQGMVPFLAEIFGEDSEVVLFDTRNDFEIVAVTNGDLSGRSVGTSATESERRIFQDEESRTFEYLDRYESFGPSGIRLLSNAFFVRDDAGDLVGVLCINTDPRRYLQAREMLNSILRVSPLENRASNRSRDSDAVASAQESIDDILSHVDTDPRLMSSSQRMAMIRQFDAKGIFDLRGAVFSAAHALGVSEATVYRYLAQARQTVTEV